MTIWCASLESGIRSYGDFCVAPNKGGCSPPDGSYLIFTKKEGTACNATDQIFVLDQDGVIYHKCSTKKVCPQGNSFLVLLCTLSKHQHSEGVIPLSSLDPLKFSFFGDRSLCPCTNISREWDIKIASGKNYFFEDGLSRWKLLGKNWIQIRKFVTHNPLFETRTLFVCFSLLFLADNNPTYGKKLMLKDKCDLSISRHVRYVVDAKAVT